MNFEIDSFKIRKNSWILGTFKIHKIRILSLCYTLDDVYYLKSHEVIAIRVAEDEFGSGVWVGDKFSDSISEPFKRRVPGRPA